MLASLRKKFKEGGGDNCFLDHCFKQYTIVSIVFSIVF